MNDWMEFDGKDTSLIVNVNTIRSAYVDKHNNLNIEFNTTGLWYNTVPYENRAEAIKELHKLYNKLNS